MKKKIKDVSVTTLLILIILYIFNIISTHGASIDQQMKDRQSINVEDKNAAFATSLANKKNMMSMIQAKNKAKIHAAGTDQEGSGSEQEGSGSEQEDDEDAQEASGSEKMED